MHEKSGVVSPAFVRRTGRLVEHVDRHPIGPVNMVAWVDPVVHEVLPDEPFQKTSREVAACAKRFAVTTTVGHGSFSLVDELTGEIPCLCSAY